jgi:hypothetical protein
MVLVCAFVLLGTGVLRHWHDAVHALADARALLAATSDTEPHDHQPPIHDASNCDVHAQLAMPLTVDGIVPLLILLGLFVAFLSMVAPEPVHVRPTLRLDCRGPPAC